MEFVSGQLVVWNRYIKKRLTLVDGEVVQSGPLRVRIRVWNAQGARLLRWVKPESIRPKQGGEPRYFYPGSPVC